jgi:beta-galactosidase
VVEIPTFENGEFEERTIIFDDRERIEIYDFNAKYEGENIDVEAFYHTPRFHWGYEGDFFGLIAEATDIPGIDVFNGKAPEGIEMTGKGVLDGLKIVAGPEIYWGANPKWVVKYDFNTKRIDWTFIHSEDVGRLGQGANATQATIRQSRQTTLSAQTQVGPVKIEAGGMMASTERIDEVYDRIDDQGNIIVDQIDFADTLAFRGKLTFPVFGAETYVSTWQAGLVSESSATPQPTFGLFDPTRLPYSGLGNKREYELGSIINVGNLMIFPRLMYRDNLVDANPFVEPAINPDGTLNPGLIPRDRDNDPFAVLGNRAARSAEVFFTWDPTGATPFYDWDNEWREDAKFAFNIGFNYTEFPTATDANLFFFEEGAANASFGIGLPAENVWSISSRMVFNPGRSTRYIATFLRSFDQPTGDPTGGSRDFWQIGGAAYIGQKHIVSGFFNKNGWGPEDFFRQFNITYDEQVEFDYSFLLGGSAGLIGDQITLLRSTRIGFRTVFRTPNESSLDVEFQDGENDFSFLSTLYFTYRF